MKQWFVSELQEALSTSTHDVQMILNYLDTRGDLDMKRVGMFGQGSGGSIAILAAAADPRIVALDVLDPWGDWPDWLKGSKQIPEQERATYLKPDFLQKVSTLDPATYLPQLKDRTVRVEQVMEYPTTPPDARDKIAGSTPKQNEITRYENIIALEKAWRSSGVAGWLGEQLLAKKIP
jgi:acetyl esterase/lipase